MAINFHEIKSAIIKNHKVNSTISDHQSFSEFFYGISEFIHVKIQNIIKINNLIEKVKVYLNVKPSNNSITFSNSIIKPVFVNLVLNGHFKNNDVLVENEVKQHIVNINGKLDNNKLVFDNDDLNVSAYLFTRLSTMTGSINDYANKTIEETGRKTIE